MAIATDDLDSDGSPDIVVTNAVTKAVSVLFGDGEGAFADKADFEVGGFPDSLALADFNDDGVTDLSVINVSTDNLSVLLGNGDGSFMPKVDYSLLDGPYSVVAGDFDMDGNVDLVVGHTNDYPDKSEIYSLSILLGYGDGSFGDRVDYVAEDGQVFVTANDFNGDDILDVVAVHKNSEAVSVYLGGDAAE